MFQYASVRTIAEQQGEKLIVINKKNQLYSAFNLGNRREVEYLKAKFLPISMKTFHLKEYSPPRNVESAESSNGASSYPERFVEGLPGNVIVDGFFQSEKYFLHNRKRVINWFLPRKQYTLRTQNIINSLKLDYSKLCIIHIRLGDFYTSDLGLGHPVLGWVLPIEYYKEALKNLPSGLRYVLISDMPDRARQWLSFLDNLVVIEGESAITDLWLLTKGKYCIISNSTFSWWGAWLNQYADKEIYAPQYFNGWWLGKWSPKHIKVNGWNYIDDEKIKSRVIHWQ